MHFQEVIRMPFWLLSLIYFFFLSFVLSVWAALGNIPAIGTLITLSILLILMYRKSALRIEVTEMELRIGRAHIERKYLGTATVLNSLEMRQTRTRDANVKAFLAIRFWSSTGIKVDVKDARDQTPYWLITSNRSVELVKALNSN
jgi:hypothetical protein